MEDPKIMITTSRDPSSKLKQFAKDARFQDEVMKVKQNNKNKLAEYLKEATGVDVNPCSLFDIQVGSIRCFSPYISPPQCDNETRKV